MSLLSILYMYKKYIRGNQQTTIIDAAAVTEELIRHQDYN